ncbi:MAG: helix-turn-helix transcriptional regulator [Solirubrobacteraceae bacterium]
MTLNDALADLYSVEDLARRLGVTKETLFRWNSGGKGPRRILIGRRIYYRHCDVQAWIAAREAK